MAAQEAKGENSVILSEVSVVSWCVSAPCTQLIAYREGVTPSALAYVCTYLHSRGGEPFGLFLVC